MGFIPLSVPTFLGKEKEYVTAAIESTWVSTGGKEIEALETELEKYLNVDGLVACQSGTAGLHLALKVLDIGLNDEVIVPTLTFIATVNPVSYVNAHPIFLDCDDSLNIDLDKLERFCEEECDLINGKLINKLTKRHVKSIIIVHVYGNLVDMVRVMDIALKYNLKVIEDATEALGSQWISGKLEGKYAGTIADVGVYSFNGNKLITTGGGGAVTAKKGEYLKRIRHLSTQAKSDALYYFHDEVGYNYRMTNLQAALGLAQLENIEKLISLKIKNYEQYLNQINQIEGLSLVKFNTGTRSNHWFYTLIVDSDYPVLRNDLIEKLYEKGIQSRPVWGLIHKQKPYENCQSYQIEKAVEYYEKLLNIPCSCNLKSDEIDYIIDTLERLNE